MFTPLLPQWERGWPEAGVRALVGDANEQPSSDPFGATLSHRGRRGPGSLSLTSERSCLPEHQPSGLVLLRDLELVSSPIVIRSPLRTRHRLRLR